MYGVDLYRRVRLACRHEGLSPREAARRFGIDRKSVAKMLAFSAPGYLSLLCDAFGGGAVNRINSRHCATATLYATEDRVRRVSRRRTG